MIATGKTQITSMPVTPKNPRSSAPPRPRARSTNLKTSLILRIAAVAVACFGLVTLAVLWEANHAERRQTETTADLVARHLDWQLMRVNAGFDASNRFPDWDALLANLPARGQCVRYVNAKGALVRNDCVGTLANEDEAPAWLLSLWASIVPAYEATAVVSYKGVPYGNVSVSAETKSVVGRVWQELQRLVALTALTILSLSVLVYVALSRALAPTNDVVAGLNRLSAGELSYRLPPARLAELQRISEVANELAAKVEGMLAERAELLQRLMNAQEEERRHLARELHDEFGQNLAAIAALAASLERSAEDAESDIAAGAHTLSRIAAGMMQSLRGTLMHLRPADLDKFGLAESLKQLIDVWSISTRDKTRFELSIPTEIGPLPDAAAVHIFRIAQEGLTNAAKHARAQTVRISVKPVFLSLSRAGTAAIELTIEDDGTGRRSNGTPAASARGLLNMQERVAALGGSITFEDRPGAGLKVCVVVPVAAEAPPPANGPAP